MKKKEDIINYFKGAIDLFLLDGNAPTEAFIELVIRSREELKTLSNEELINLFGASYIVYRTIFENYSYKIKNEEKYESLDYTNDEIKEIIYNIENLRKK